MVVSEICLSKILSTRTYNLCTKNCLANLDDIMKYYEINNNFYHLENFGRRSNNELVDLCVKYMNTDYRESLLKNDKIIFSNIISELSENKKNIINNYIGKLFNELSVRSQNGLNYFLEKKINVININSKVLSSNNFNFNLIQNIGAKSSIELDAFFQKIKNIITEINNSDDYEKTDEKKLVYDKLFPSLRIPEDKVSELKSIIKLIDYLFYQETFFNEIENLIFYNTFNIYRDHKYIDNQQLAESVNLSIESIRVKKIMILKKLYEKLEFIINIDDEIIKLVGIDLGIEFIKIDESKLDIINETYNTKFSKEFIFLILYIIFSNDYEMIFDSDFILNKSVYNKKKYRPKNYYLIKKNNVATFNFKSFLYELNLILLGENKNKFELDLNLFLKRFSKNNIHEVQSINNKIACKLIVEEFDIKISKNNTIIIERNTPKLNLEFAIEILNKIGEPTKLETIYNNMINENPNIKINQQYLRTKLNRSDEIIHFGRSSTFGLKKWEKEKSYLKGGTIRELISELLLINNRPIHIKDIYKFIIKYRPNTNIKSIKTNISLSNKFIKFQNNYIGLSSNKYHENYYDKSETDKNISEIINENAKTIFNNISNEIINGKSEFSSLLKKMILENKILESIQLCSENYNTNNIELNFKDYFIIINEIKKLL